MARFKKHLELHKTARISWLRAAVLGANDGIVSTASLIVGVAAAHASRADILLSGTAGLVAGAMSMAAGEYVSVSSQADTEQADLAREAGELKANPASEVEELTQIYVGRGLDQELAGKVAVQLMARDALGAHARDELGITDTGTARPIQAAVASAASFSVGAALPLTAILVSSFEKLAITVSSVSLFFLIMLGIVAAVTGGASPVKGALRVGFWGAFAMAATALIGRFFETTVS
ncbi:MAG: VIT1/CCC1 transporter family protein [Bdellovibrionota bacterium]